jgi:hypothetical protein
VLNLLLHKKLADVLHQYAGEQVPANIQEKEFAPFFQYLKKNKLSPEPVFPGSTDESLIPHFLVNVPEELAKKIQPELTKIPGVSGAWIKPADESPA